MYIYVYIIIWYVDPERFVELHRRSGYEQKC